MNINLNTKSGLITIPKDIREAVLIPKDIDKEQLDIKMFLADVNPLFILLFPDKEVNVDTFDKQLKEIITKLKELREFVKEEAGKNE